MLSDPRVSLQTVPLVKTGAGPEGSSYVIDRRGGMRVAVSESR